MAAKETKIFPIRGHWTHAAPAAVHIVGTKAEADDLIATGAFTDNPNHADRDHDAPDLTARPEPEAEVPAADQPIANPDADEGSQEPETEPDAA